MMGKIGYPNLFFGGILRAFKGFGRVIWDRILKIDEFHCTFSLHAPQNWITLVTGQERVVRFQTRYFSTKSN